MSESRETIKSRMLRTVAKMWGSPGVEQEASFDPLVTQLINACAAELAKINREKKLSQYHLMEEVARLLLPDADMRATPAHAIASASPMDEAGYAVETEQFLCREQPPETSGEVHFSPTGRFPLQNTEVKFQASGKQICTIIDHKYKNVLGYAEGDRLLPAHTLYVGLQVNDHIESVEEMCLFFNILNIEHRDFFFNHLKNSRWFLCGERLETVTGYPSAVRIDESLEERIQNRYRTHNAACRDINRFYQRQFLTLKNIEGLGAARGNLPAEMRHVFTEDTLGEVNDNLVWLEAVFPGNIPAELLEDVFCFTNCFPVLNTRDHDLMFRLQENLNIIPLKCTDFFFDIKRIVDSENKSYHIHSDNNEPTELENIRANHAHIGRPGDNDEPAAPTNSVVIRTNGVKRFGALDAKEEVQYLLETLRDETASYAAMGGEEIERIVSEINIHMGDLEEKISRAGVDDMISYLVMRNPENRDSLFVEFWSTAGEGANNIDAGMRLENRGRSLIQPESSVLVTSTMGGRNRLSDDEKLTSFKRVLLANDRLVTAEDIKAFCREQLGARVKQVAITKGLVNGIAKKEGLVRTIDVSLTPDHSMATTPREWNFLLQDLLAKIRMRTA
ncbi:MAG TPA: hypothetical protein VK074_12150, partial [Fodinibius sp.]|nr:hypothetical protein [Fodinibius sp.]